MGNKEKKIEISLYNDVAELVVFHEKSVKRVIFWVGIKAGQIALNRFLEHFLVEE